MSPFIYLDTTTLTTTTVSDSTTVQKVPPLLLGGQPRFLTPWGNRITTYFGNLGHLPYDHIAYYPIQVDTTSTYDRIGIGVVANNASLVRTFTYDIGLYSNNNGYPGNRITDFGSVSVSSATGASNQLITISQQLTANTIYWIAVGVTTDDPTTQPYGFTPYLASLLGDFKNMKGSNIGQSSPSSTAPAGLVFIEQFGTFGGTLPASAAGTPSLGLSGYPLVGLRRSA
jgi:hypothetical protein